MKRRWVNPCEESLAKHLLINGEKVEPQTETGRWMAKRLNLNEGEHLARRADRQRKPELIAALRTLILKLAPAERSMALEHLEELASLCVDASPHDPVDGCRCDAASMEVVTAPTPASAPAVVSERLENKQRVAELLAELGLSATVEQALSRKKR